MLEGVRICACVDMFVGAGMFVCAHPHTGVWVGVGMFVCLVASLFGMLFVYVCVRVFAHMLVQ